MESLVDQLASSLSGRRVLITGAAGFIGCHLTKALVDLGARVVALESPQANPDPLVHLLSDIEYLTTDIRDKVAVQRAVNLAHPSFVFHLAAVGVTRPFLPLEEALTVNLFGSINLIEACFSNRESDERVRLVLTGTPYEYGQTGECEPCPINPYAASKAAAFAVARMYQRTKGWPIVTVRPFQVYGPGQPKTALIPAALEAVRLGQTFSMTAGEQRRDFIYVDDIVSGYLLAAVRGKDGAGYDLGWGKSFSLKETITLLYSVIKSGVEPAYGALAYRPGEIWEMKANPIPASRDLQWKPRIGLIDGLELTAKSYPRHNDQST